MLSSLLKKLLTNQPQGTTDASATGETGATAGILVPAEIFATDLAPAESLVKYLKENHGLAYHEIGQALKRDERGIWGTYRRASKKMPGRFDDAESLHKILLTAFSDRSKSILEATMIELHDAQGMRFVDIAKMLNKAYSTVYTTYLKANKSEKKRENKGHDRTKGVGDDG